MVKMYTDGVTESYLPDNYSCNSILLEYYEGKSKPLMRCEQYLKEIIAMIKRDHNTPLFSKSTGQRYRDAKPCKLLEKELCEFFKFKDLKIYWSSGEMNAYTIFLINSPIVNHNYKVGKPINRKCMVFIYEQLISVADINERELLAIILHEIGHNLYFSPLLTLTNLIYYIITPFEKIISSVINMVASGVSSIIFDVIKKYLPDVSKFVDQIGDVVVNSQMLVKPIKVIDGIVGLMNGKTFILPNIYGLFDYGNELAADSLAAKYGYGPDLITAFKKMEHPTNTPAEQLWRHTGTFGSVMNDLIDLTTMLISMMTLEPHPNTNQRARSILDKLKRDLKRSEYPPEMKRDLENEIDRMEKIYNTLNDVTYGDNNIQIKKAWYNILDTVTNGHSDVRELLTPYWNLFTF